MYIYGVHDDSITECAVFQRDANERAQRGLSRGLVRENTSLVIFLAYPNFLSHPARQAISQKCFSLSSDWNQISLNWCEFRGGYCRALYHTGHVGGKQVA